MSHSMNMTLFNWGKTIITDIYYYILLSILFLTKKSLKEVTSMSMLNARQFNNEKASQISSGNF